MPSNKFNNTGNNAQNNNLMFTANRLSQREYSMILNGQQLAEMWDENQIRYNPIFQRGTIIKTNKDGEKKECAVYNQKKVDEIAETIKKDKLYSSMITLNVLDTIKVTYDENTNILNIDDDHLDVLDGQHRTRALHKIYKENKECENPYDLKQILFEVKISVLNVVDAQEQFYQFTLGTPISSSRKEFFNNTNNSNIIAKKLFNESVLKGKIENVKNSISKKETEKVVAFNTLKEAIELSFDVKDKSEDEINNIYEFLKEYFNELFKLVPEFNDYDARLHLREEGSFKCDNFSMYAYVAIASLLYKDYPNWRNLLPQINNINFSKENEYWHEVMKLQIKEVPDKKAIESKKQEFNVNQKASIKEEKEEIKKIKESLKKKKIVQETKDKLKNKLKKHQSKLEKEKHKKFKLAKKPVEKIKTYTVINNSQSRAKMIKLSQAIFKEILLKTYVQK